MSEGMEATGRMGEKTKAYRKGKSTTDITVDERCIMEEALEFLQLLGLVKEDEERVFFGPTGCSSASNRNATFWL